MQVTTQTTPQHHDLISQHIGLARKVARGIARRLPQSVEREELEGVAMVALAEAAQRYDTQRESSFGAYAACRIRGAVLDELRRLDPMGRRARQRVKRAEKAGLKVATLKIESLQDDHGFEPVCQAEPVDEQVYYKSRLSALQPAVEALPERMQKILALYYIDGRSQAEIGAELGITESRVCQLRGQALRRLRQQLAH